MAGEIFQIPGVLPQAERPSVPLREVGSRENLRAVVMDGMRISVWEEEGGETIWVQIRGGLADVNHWYGPGDLRNSRVQALVDSLLGR